MAAISHGQKLKAIVTALKMRLYLSFGFGYSKLFPARDALLIRADRNVRRRITSIQRLPARLVILTTLGLFFTFFVAENKTGLLLVLVLLPPVIIPLAALLGALVSARIDTIDVCLRRESMRLRHEAGSCQGYTPSHVPKKSISERLLLCRSSFYQETRKMRRATRLRHAR